MRDPFDDPSVNTTAKPDPVDHRATPFGRSILAGLQGKHVYQGTAASKRGDRRAANRRARASRKANR